MVDLPVRDEGGRRASGRRPLRRMRWICLTSALALGCAALALWVAWDRPPQDAEYYVVDTQRLIEAKLSRIVASRTTAEEARREGESFAVELDATLKGLAERGALVINRNAIIAFPPDRDVTTAIARRLNVDLASAPESEGSASVTAPASGMAHQSHAP